MPSTSRDMTLDDLKIALVNYIVAQQKNSHFILRILDTQSPNIEGKDSEIVQILEKFAIKDDRRYHQSEHLSLHQKLAIQLLEEKKAFICTCIDSNKCLNQCHLYTQQELSQIKNNNKDFIIRIKSSQEREISSFTILDKNNKPTYNFAIACDDIIDDIEINISNQQDRENIKKEEYIQQCFNFNKTVTKIYLPIFLDDTKLQTLLEQGFIPDAIINYILISICNDTPKEIFTLPEAIQWFQIEKLSQNDIKLNIETLKNINKQHLLNLNNKTLSKIFGFADDDIGALVKLYLEKYSTIPELEKQIKAIFAPKNLDNQFGQHMRIVQNILFEAPFIDEYNELKAYILNHSDLTDEEIEISLKLLLTNNLDDDIEISHIYKHIKTYLLEVIS